MPYFRTDRRNKIYYELIENPEVSQTLVFVHGWAENHKVWREQLEFFQDKYKLLIYDLRGFGLSSKPTYGYSLKLQSKYLHNLIQTLNLTDYWLIGHSLGGMITLHYAEKYSAELNGAVLIDTTSYIPTKVTTLRSLGTFFISKTLRTIWQKTLKTMRTENRRTLIQDLIHDVDSVPLYTSAACGIAVLNSRIDLKEITCPIQIIVGADDELTPVGLSEKMHQKLPNSRLAIIPDTGHMSFIEKPDEINLLLAEFFHNPHHNVYQ
ncbi:MAG TPA: alpha/beta hydrolase [Candidatus Deferrimicrobium sp.]|nr:alpha/beta hydrolase [Candidatus Deferrimicrobium sp.]